MRESRIEKAGVCADIRFLMTLYNCTVQGRDIAGSKIEFAHTVKMLIKASRLT